MGALARRLGTKAVSFPYGFDGFTPMGADRVYIGSSAGQAISSDSSLGYSAFWSAVRVLSETLAQIPLIIYRRLPDGGKERAVDHPSYDLLHTNPNPEMTSFIWRETGQSHVVTWGNHYSEKVFDSTGRLVELWPLKPDRMTVRREGNDRVYRYRKANGDQIDMAADKVFHVPGLGWDGTEGYSVLTMARQATGLGLSAEQFGATFFSQGASTSGIISTPADLDQSGADTLREKFEGRHSGLTKAHRTGVLTNGASYTSTSIPPEDAQFLQCVVPGTLISMADGTRRKVEDLRAGDEIVGWSEGPEVSRVAAVGRPPDKVLVRIRTARGRSITTSYDHPFLGKKALRTPGGREDATAPEWIKGADLAIGNYVRVALGIPTGVTYKALGHEQAYFLGAMVGDGYIRAGGCSFSNADEGVLAAVGGAVGAMGGSLRRTSRYDHSVLTGGHGRAGSPIRTLLTDAEVAGTHADTKRVPAIVMRGGPETWCSFLSGYLDTDGSIMEAGPNQPKVAWSSVSRGLLEDCQQLLAYLGINASIFPVHAGGPRLVMGYVSDAKPAWGLYVTGASCLRSLAELLTPAHAEKRRRLASFRSLAASRYRDAIWSYDRVTSVEYMGIGATVGVEIEGVHTHVTAGLVTHNTRKFQVTEMARFFRLPPHMIADLEHATFTNIEHQSLEFVKFSMLPWLTRWEQQINKDLLGGDPLYFAEFLVDGLERADALTRAQALMIRRQNGTINADDWRAIENMNPLPDGQGQEYWQPLNMTKVGPDPVSAKIASDLVLAGFDPAEVLAAIGMPPIKHLGIPPRTLQQAQLLDPNDPTSLYLGAGPTPPDAGPDVGNPTATLVAADASVVPASPQLRRVKATNGSHP